MLLTQHTIQTINADLVHKPTAISFSYPEKILQFGTGVLLRGLPDYFVHKANQQNLFQGRVLVVKSTASAGADAFEQQNSLYTLCIKGIEDGMEVAHYEINNAISRVLSANQHWEEILKSAENPDLEIVFSNTTEVGITMSDDNVNAMPPASFPGKLLAVLYRRFVYFNGDTNKGLTIVPTELITENGSKLKSIITALAKLNELPDSFMDWLDTANDFCNTLVDRIVPGALPSTEYAKTCELLGYEDQLMIMAEPFRLWAIESLSERVNQRLSFALADSNVLLVPSIEKYKEIKLRLLNGTHTLSCALALLSGFNTVKEAMKNYAFHQFVSSLMRDEIGPAIVSETISVSDINDFSSKVIDRFANPHLEHKWESIALNYSSKMAMRNIPLLKKWYAKHHEAPQLFALGFAAYLYFLKSEQKDDHYIRVINGHTIELQDELAPKIYAAWANQDQIVHTLLSAIDLWGEDLTEFARFEETVKEKLQLIAENGALKAIELSLAFDNKKV
ncbi:MULTISPECIES: tagaturonate reductase [unclassified Sphingobacterium]|uniref:tagaturonate reductase n=1 Tax=unclassified Sphingobacterium TaxID=2609468 RepID=UPI0025D2B024|nr:MULTISPECIES: tagaturonate reductase [unclassified Sphingobacterium]